ncbi:hypothetical protein [Chrysiogenes arsenatis]|uniref:hypothetical protein n=1 Tax=Chrysiogenes arsenatis TaxID=309797 RepID=UPI000422554A|nr:hypothetical protein [Chrysiogenes arsenatis]
MKSKQLPIAAGFLAGVLLLASGVQASEQHWNSTQNPVGISCATCHFDGYDLLVRGEYPHHNPLAGRHMTLLDSIRHCRQVSLKIDTPDNTVDYALFQFITTLKEYYDLSRSLANEP